MAEAIREGDIPGVQIRQRQRLDVDVEEAWRWLTEQDRLQAWLAQRVEIEPGARGGVFLERREGRSRVVETATTRRLEAPRVWVLEFRKEDPAWEAPTRLELRLRPVGDGCELDLLQRGFQHLALSACLTLWEEYRRRWRRALARLQSASSSPTGA